MQSSNRIGLICPTFVGRKKKYFDYVSNVFGHNEHFHFTITFVDENIHDELLLIHQLKYYLWPNA
jgi:hypothetical protein